MVHRNSIYRWLPVMQSGVFHHHLDVWREGGDGQEEKGGRWKDLERSEPSNATPEAKGRSLSENCC